MTPLQHETVWKFIRGDVGTQEFETWFYAQEEALKHDLGETLHFDMISLDYSDRNGVFEVKQKLEKLVRSTLKCECISLRDKDVIPMGCDDRDQRFFETVNRHWQSDDRWWLSLNTCKVCHQNWIIAQEERIFDDYFIERIAPEIANLILTQNRWPDMYLTYEAVLKVGRERSQPCRFFDRLPPSLVWTAQDLKQNRPDISIPEIAWLLGIDEDHVKELLAAKSPK
ncbi:hypothetical protein [Asticcacaulis machinosus]|uniref:Uncharacterized protein n=1 Tax=Asticcacaulis machinosus TaxID=2984211 RepID=A0ABT5HM59_9CAUL|nr:hypothetical protein [Asticcacaulis machinosus]MDC7677262.1 hypothetical protein [Asticcacaulis machinosus]